MDNFMEENSKKQQDAVAREQIQDEEEHSNIIIRFLKGIYEMIVGKSKKTHKVNVIKTQGNEISKKYDQHSYKKEPEQEKTNEKQKEEIRQSPDIFTNSNSKETVSKPVENKFEEKNETKKM